MAAALDNQDQPRPEFDVSTPHIFKVVMFAAGHTDQKLMELGLNIRQVEVINYLRLHDRITVADYQTMYGTSKATATRDLGDLVGKGFVTRQGKSIAVNYSLSDSA